MEDEDLFTNDKRRRLNLRSFAFLHHRSVIAVVLGLCFIFTVWFVFGKSSSSLALHLATPTPADPVAALTLQRLAGLKRLLDDGLITESDHQKQKDIILAKFIEPSPSPDPEDVYEDQPMPNRLSHNNIQIREYSAQPVATPLSHDTSPSSSPDPEDVDDDDEQPLPSPSPSAIPPPPSPSPVVERKPPPPQTQPPRVLAGGVGPDGLFVQVPASQFTPRQNAVRDAYLHAWNSYKNYAWGLDELRPVSKQGQASFELALTMIDGLDTLYVMSENERFNEAVDWIRNSLTLTRTHGLNVFETTIRVLGGLLSAFTLSGRRELLDKASELGHRLKPAMQERHHYIAHSDVDLSNGVASLGMGKVSISEATTLQLEFKTLAHLQENKEFFHMMESSADAIDEMRLQLPHDKRGLVPMFIHLDAGRFESGSTLTLGARGDSYYEYLLKQWLLTNKEQQKFAERYLEAIRDVDRHLVAKTHGSKQYVFVGELVSSQSFYPKMDHLVCFLPGLLALGYQHKVGSDTEMARHLELAKELMRTCVDMYTTTATGLAPEITHFDTSNTQHSEMYVKPADAHNILRPEVVESLMVMYRVTGDTVYQDWGWDIFQAFEKHSRISGGYSGLQNVLSTSSPRIDKMESFFLAETLKYLFLLFDDTKAILPLDQYVFNTEAHPLRMFSMKDL